MKIGVIGNMNNMYFSLTRYLIDSGYDCEQLIYNNEPSHFHPSHDTYHTAYKKYCKQLTWGDPAGFLKQDLEQVKKDLAPYDFLIGNGAAPAFVTRIGRKLDIFIPYGDDLYSLPFLKMVHPVRVPAYLLTSYYQRKGIKNSPYIIFDKASTRFEKVFAKLKYTGKRIFSPPPLLYHKEYNQTNMINSEEGNPYNEQLKKLRQENELIILQNVRHIWKRVADQWNLKGNDLLIKGFATFLKENPRIKCHLILFEYGVHVKDTKELIYELQIQDHVTWFPKMARKNLMHFISASDVIVGELFHSWLTYCVVFEALCMGKPLMHKRIDADFRDAYPQLYPMIHASSAQSVAEGLSRLVNDKSKVDELARQAHAWFLEYCVRKPISEVINIINEKELETAC